MKQTIYTLSCLLSLTTVLGCASGSKSTQKNVSLEQNLELLLASKVDWQQLNPARGDESPKAATLWGDRKGKVATGFLFHGVDGFKSPPHVHNVSYRGIVLRGLIHNDDEAAPSMWMPKLSFWTQPKGQAHITAVKGPDSLAYIEIDSGPYLVRPTEQAFDSPERPVNVDASNLVWVSAAKGVQTAFLWGAIEGKERNGRMIRLPVDSKAVLYSQGAEFRLVVTQGTPTLHPTGERMEIGSYLRSSGGGVKVSCEGSEGCIFYVHTRGGFEVRIAE